MWFFGFLGYKNGWHSIYGDPPATFPITQMPIGTIAGKCHPI
jgi:hypothetical protein